MFSRCAVIELYHSSDQIKKTDHVARMREGRVFVEKPEERRLLGKPWCRREDNIKVNVREVELGHGLDRSSL
jgi:hypothetical protein